MKISPNQSAWLRLLLFILSSLSSQIASAQSRPAVDSMGANMGRQNWKAAFHWALKAAESDSADRYWRYLNAAHFASLDKNADMAIKYAGLVLDSDIAPKAAFGKDFDWLRDDPRWKQLMKKKEQVVEDFRQKRIQESLPFRFYQKRLLDETKQQLAALPRESSGRALYQTLKAMYPAHNYTRHDRYQYAWVKLADSLEFPYLIQLPKGFDAAKNYPLVVILHGAVAYQTMRDVADSSAATGFFGHNFVNLAYEAGTIAVFPYSTKRYNWMMPDDGFGLVPTLIREVKHMYPIDDSRVYVTGYSNGATGAFSYLMKQPGLFAGFSGVNNRPQVRTGGTFLKNAANRSFYNVATDYDYYYPIEGHRTFTALAKTLGINWQNIEITGKRNHSYLLSTRDSTIRQMYQRLFADMLSKKRNPFQPNLYWECDDIKNGRCDWLEINELDTLTAKSSWQVSVNATIEGWRQTMNPSVLLDSTSQAFHFPRQSGAVKAKYSGNTFDLTTSRVGKITLYFSPEMVDLNKPVSVIINGKQIYHGPVRYDRTFLMSEFEKEMDHQALWVNKMTFWVNRLSSSTSGQNSVRKRTRQKL
ncbi:hypothetical protein [Dyadobacter luticola]|uniref:Uncharacterized protein n=1 Tax=Dyadobacter luticola TaxID=1979387 RepID=A0A5R9L2S2_9BACT|nr:hypothetical protein [Dyadobacter luticola]TLV02843.1 hypothetical protein FEN17_04295 [Dyadobacter luticola]